MKEEKPKKVSIDIIYTKECNIVDTIVADLVNIGIMKFDYRYMAFSFLVIEIPKGENLSKFQKIIRNANRNIKGISLLPDDWDVKFRDFSISIVTYTDNLKQKEYIRKLSRTYMYEDQSVFQRGYLIRGIKTW